MIFRQFFLSGLVLAMVVAAAGCVNHGGDNNSNGQSTATQSTSYLLAYAHSADYATYKLDWLQKTGSTYALMTNQISVSSSGLHSPTVYNGYWLIVDSSATGRLLAYRQSDLSLAGQINVGSYLGDMVISGTTAYIANGATPTNLLKRVDLSNLPSLALLADIVVGNQPSVVRIWNGMIYVGNQDWNNKVQATISVVNPATNTVTNTFNTGHNNMEIAYDGTRIWSFNSDWYNVSYVCQNGVSLTYAAPTAYTPATVTAPAGYTASSNCVKAGLAFNNNQGYAAFRNASGNFDLFSITGTAVNATAVDTTNQYKFVGSGGTYLYKIHNGNGSTNNLTTNVEDMNGNLLTTQTFTKDADMYFFAMQ